MHESTPIATVPEIKKGPDLAIRPKTREKILTRDVALIQFRTVVPKIVVLQQMTDDLNGFGVTAGRFADRSHQIHQSGLSDAVLAEVVCADHVVSS